MQSREQYELRELVARSRGDAAGLAHSLRHLAELSFVQGDLATASTNVDEAITLYRTKVINHKLDLANALRVRALVDEARAAKASAIIAWREARKLYAEHAVADGVAECDRHLPESPPQTAPLQPRFRDSERIAASATSAVGDCAVSPSAEDCGRHAA